LGISLNRHENIDQLFHVLSSSYQSYPQFRTFVSETGIKEQVVRFVMATLPRFLTGNPPVLNLSHLLKLLVAFDLPIKRLPYALRDEQFLIMVCLSLTHPSSVSLYVRKYFTQTGFKSFLFGNGSALPVIRVITIIFCTIPENAVDLCLTLRFQLKAPDVDISACFVAVADIAITFECLGFAKRTFD
jgi:hypothetical protein